jgi:ubiquinone/menaquinone biosynthesis C-methylase UbiE
MGPVLTTAAAGEGGLEGTARRGHHGTGLETPREQAPGDDTVRRAVLTILLLAAIAPGAPAEEPGPHDATTDQKFQDIQRWVERFESPDRASWQKPGTVMRVLGLAPGDRVADLGAGTGYFTAWLSGVVDRNGRVYAVDIEPGMLEYIRKRENIHHDNVITVLADLDDPKLPEGELDLVLIVDTWHHLDDRLSYLERLRRTLRAAGRIAVIDWHAGELPEGPPPGHKLSREAVLGEFEKAGWTLDTESVALPYQYFLIFSPPAADTGP